MSTSFNSDKIISLIVKTIVALIVIFIVAIFIFIKVHDIQMEDLGRSVAPYNKMWVKDNYSQLGISSEMGKCRDKNNIDEQTSYDRELELVSLCMIKKGFRFSPRGDGNYLNWCGGSRDNTVACLFYNSKIILNEQGQVVWKKTGKEVDVNDLPQ